MGPVVINTLALHRTRLVPLKVVFSISRDAPWPQPIARLFIAVRSGEGKENELRRCTEKGCRGTRTDVCIAIFGWRLPS